MAGSEHVADSQCSISIKPISEINTNKDTKLTRQ